MEKLKFNSEEAENDTKNDTELDSPDNSNGLEIDNVAVADSRREKRRKNYENYEREVLSKIENVAIARHELENIVRENPDISAKNLRIEFDSRTNKLDLLPEQIAVAHACIYKYLSLHGEVRRYRERFPDDKDLFKGIFGHEPKGKVEIQTGPMTIFLICYNIEDYATVYTGKRNLEDQDIQIARRSGGVSTGSSPVHGLDGAIIAENCADHKYPAETIRIHEEQHAIHRLFDKPLSGASYEYYFNAEDDPKKRRLLILQYFRYRREEIGEHRVTDEILAHKKEGRGRNEILEILMQKTEKGGLYGYFDSVKKELAKEYVHIPDIEDMVHEVFVVEYKKLIENALVAFDSLKRSTDLNTDEEIAYFTMIPIRHWPKMVKRRKKFFVAKSFNERVLVKENRFWQDYECVAEEFDRMGKTRHKQKNKKKRK